MSTFWCGLTPRFVILGPVTWICWTLGFPVGPVVPGRPSVDPRHKGEGDGGRARVTAAGGGLCAEGLDGDVGGARWTKRFGFRVSCGKHTLASRHLETILARLHNQQPKNASSRNTELLRTERLNLRPSLRADVVSLFEFLGDAEAMKFTHVDETLRQCQRRVMVHEWRRRRDGCAPWVASTRRDDRIIGWGWIVSGSL